MQTYKDLKIWQINQDCLAKLVHLLEKLPNSMPVRTISEQLFRSLSSVGANLAEGYSSYEGKEYSRYANIALRSAVESDHWLTTLSNLFSDRRSELEEIASANIESIKMLKGLIKGIVAKRNP